MRPIKFRVWDKSLEEMRYSINIPSDYTERNGSLDLINMFQTLCQRYVFMQYTGLKDKNGKEIYEGDIISTDLSRPYLVVEFRNGGFMYQCHDGGQDYYDFMLPVDAETQQDMYSEVIGNIYEHPHLLEVQHD